ncbi:hypothetical protein DPMN_148984 [Dreissena polymorpha]|uniref:Uncharacterized protein n=1 Tax=Dreissena polymorpha TaxID=45954 RepID=A0A9D4FCX7_DREPO|nr:hypothetical protein DPMN_148984 [Dreissena polymorpha]
MVRTALSSQVIYTYMESILYGKFQDVILRLGGMHFLMSFVGSEGTLMANSRLKELPESTFAGVSKLLNGLKYPQNVRVLRIVTWELFRNVFTENNVQTCDDLEMYLNNKASADRTSRSWVDCLIKAVFLLMIYVPAEREGYLSLIKLTWYQWCRAGRPRDQKCFEYTNYKAAKRNFRRLHSVCANRFMAVVENVYRSRTYPSLHDHRPQRICVP